MMPFASRDVMWPRSVAVGAALLLAASCGKAALEEATTTAAVAVSVETAAEGTIESAVTASGIVEPLPGGDWTITAPDAARILEMPKAEGDRVSPGDLLVRFDIPSLSADLEGKKAGVAQAQAQVTRADQEVARITPLAEKGIAAQREVEDARRAQAEAKAALDQARSAEEAASDLADRVVVRARFAGVVAKRWHNPGDLVDGSVSDPVLRVVNPSVLQVSASIAAADVPRVIAGHTGFVIGPSGEGEPIKIVTRPAFVDPATRLASVRLAFDKPTTLTPGTPVQVILVAESHANAVIVPAAAVVRNDDEVFVMAVDKDHKAHRRDVVVGLTSPEKAEILSGITAGDVVVFRGQDDLPDGGLVSIVK